jgi:uncharacterized protein (TIGR03437 family)
MPALVRVAIVFLFVLPAASQVISSLSPSEASAGSPNLTLTIDGSEFAPDARVIWRYGSFGATQLTSTFVNSGRLSAVVPAGLLTQPGSFTVGVCNPPQSAGCPARVFTVTSGLVIQTACPLPDAVPGQAYNLTLTAGGGNAPFTWTIDSGALPSGLSLSTDGVIAGTPLSETVADFVIRVRDSQQRTATKGCSLRVTATPSQQVSLETIAPSQVIAGAPATEMLLIGSGFVSGARVVWNFGTASASLLQIVSQTPTQIRAQLPAALLAVPGEFLVAVETPGPGGGFVASNRLVFRVLPAVSILTPCPLPEATAGAPYSIRIQASGGNTPHRFEIGAGALPPGLTLAPGGDLSGTPSAAGLFQFTLRARDNLGNPGDRECSLRVRGPFQVSPALLRFEAIAGAAAPAPQLLSITGEAGARYNFQVQPAGSNWVRPFALATQLPALVRVGVDVGGLAPGDYQARLNIEVQGAIGPSRSVEVHLTVRPSGLLFTARPSALTFAFARNETEPQFRLFEVVARGHGQVQVQASVETPGGAGWLSLAPSSALVSGVQPAQFRLQASAAGLPAGVHRAMVRITSVAGADPVELPVIATVSTGPDRLQLSHAGMTVEAAAGQVPPPRRFSILLHGQSNLFWRATASTLDGVNWLRVVPDSGSLQPGQPVEAEIQFETGHLAPGQYFGQVRVEAVGADNSPRLLAVALNVAPPSSDPRPLIIPSNLTFNAAANTHAAVPQSITITNPSNQAAALDFNLSGDAALWTIESDGGNVIEAGGERRLLVRPTPGSRGPGIYRAHLILHLSSDAAARAVELVLVLAPQGGACAPTTLLPALTSLPIGFTQRGGLPAALAVSVQDDCGRPLSSGLVSVASSAGSPIAAALTHAGGGVWTGTWNVTESAATALSLTVTAEDPARGLRGSLQVPGFVEANPGMPVIHEGGVVSAASFSPAPLAPGGLFAIFGSGLAAGRNSAGLPPLPADLGGTRVEIDGRETPLFFAGESGSITQVNGKAPFDLLANVTHHFAVRSGNRRSAIVEVPFAVASPSVLTVDQSGRGQAIVVDGANPTVLADAANPVRRPGVITIYCEGLGPVTQAVQAGRPSPALPLAHAIHPVEVTIGGVPARVDFAGLSPFWAGLYQINAVLTTEMPAGNAVPIVVRAAGQPSRVTTIAIR